MSELVLVFPVLAATAIVGIWTVLMMRRFMKQREEISAIRESVLDPVVEDATVHENVPLAA